MKEYFIASSHSSAVASAEHTGKGVVTPHTPWLHLLVFSIIIHGHEGHFVIDRDKTFRALLLMFLTSIPKKIETALLKTRNLQPDYRGRVTWNMHSVVVQCLYLPTSMLLLTLACGFPKITPEVGT